MSSILLRAENSSPHGKSGIPEINSAAIHPKLQISTLANRKKN